ncbi:MAG TPA: RNA polymerase sigma factor [Polyangia bacterium]|jgi:RNA polymerase sigma-70 factor (ECF subfamily)|nr:RNA polymerase sigma factor [Polyangia bacterium]
MIRSSASPRRSTAAAAAKDANLVDAAAGGDRNAFAELYRRHLDSVHARLTRVIGPASERDDLVQQIFLDVYRALRRFRGDAAFTTFLHRIVLNVACEHLERRRRARGRSEPLEARQLETLIAPGASPEQRARQRQELTRLFALLEGLSPKRRAAFVLVAIESLPLEEAATLLDARPAAIKQRVLDARRELARALDRAPKEDSR